jgi:hypothetical protein
VAADIGGVRFWLADGDECDSIVGVTARESLPTDLVAAHAMILAERAARVEAQALAASAQPEATSAKAEAADAQADLSSTEAFISHLKLEIEKLRRQRRRRGLCSAALLPSRAVRPGLSRSRSR